MKTGLTNEEVIINRKKYGKNEFTKKKQDTLDRKSVV